MVERLPIKFFSKREEDKQRVEGNSNKDLPKWVLSGDELTIKSEQLVAGFDEIITKIKWEARTVPVIMQATLNKDAHAKSHRKKIESVFATKKNNILGVGDENTLLIKVDSLEDAREMQIRLKDVDKIGLYIDVFFKGHLSKMMGLKNAFSALYERFMSKYTVTKPQYDEDFDSEALFDQIFGSKIDEE